MIKLTDKISNMIENKIMTDGMDIHDTINFIWEMAQECVEVEIK